MNPTALTDNQSIVDKVLSTESRVKKLEYYLANNIWPDEILYQLSLAGLQLEHVRANVINYLNGRTICTKSNQPAPTFHTSKVSQKSKQTRLQFNLAYKTLAYYTELGDRLVLAGVDLLQLSTGYITYQLQHNLANLIPYSDLKPSELCGCSTCSGLSMLALSNMHTKNRELLSDKLEKTNKCIEYIVSKYSEINCIIEYLYDCIEHTNMAEKFYIASDRELSEEKFVMTMSAAISSRWNIQHIKHEYNLDERDCDTVTPAGFYFLMAITDTIVSLTKTKILSHKSLSKERNELLSQILPLYDFLMGLHRVRRYYSQGHNENLTISLKKFSCERINIFNICRSVDALVSFI
ncbi:MAG: hypothetical protein HC932_00145 [Thermales bacterium]|nr:hypothetical protein [Thermales bacterium]